MDYDKAAGMRDKSDESIAAQLTRNGGASGESIARAGGASLLDRLSAQSSNLPNTGDASAGGNNLPNGPEHVDAVRTLQDPTLRGFEAPLETLNGTFNCSYFGIVRIDPHGFVSLADPKLFATADNAAKDFLLAMAKDCVVAQISFKSPRITTLERKDSSVNNARERTQQIDEAQTAEAMEGIANAVNGAILGGANAASDGNPLDARDAAGERLKLDWSAPLETLNGCDAKVLAKLYDGTRVGAFTLPDGVERAVIWNEYGTATSEPRHSGFDLRNPLREYVVVDRDGDVVSASLMTLRAAQSILEKDDYGRELKLLRVQL